jgi:histidinol-phosphate aminotransferase
MAGAKAAIEDEDYFQQTRKKVMDTRAWAAKALREIGFTVLDSKANFLFVSRPGQDGKQLLDDLRAEGILVRWWKDPLIRDWLRITIGTDEEMEALVQALKTLTQDA